MRRWGVSTALLGLLIAWRLFFVGADSSPERAAPPTTPSFSRPAQSTSRQKAPLPPPPNPHKLRATTERQEDDAVSFEVKEGFAVAYGDIILGVPDDPSVKTGYYEPPPMQTWDRPEIPFAIDPLLPHPERVREAIRYFHDHTPVRFVPYEGQTDAIAFEPGQEHCYSALGRVGGVQPIHLSPECEWHEIAHEILHALGFVHEQSRPDRDAYVEVIWDNIEEKYRRQFEIVPNTLMQAERGTPFDYQSIMLYRPEMFTKARGMVAMRSRTSTPIAPVRKALSPGDIERINRLYGR